jgi:hypothetical protein
MGSEKPVATTTEVTMPGPPGDAGRTHRQRASLLGSRRSSPVRVVSSRALCRGGAAAVPPYSSGRLQLGIQEAVDATTGGALVWSNGIYASGDGYPRQPHKPVGVNKPLALEYQWTGFTLMG